MSYPERRLIFLRSEEHTSELQSQSNLVCRLLLEKKKYGCRVGNRRIRHHQNPLFPSAYVRMITRTRSHWLGLRSTYEERQESMCISYSRQTGRQSHKT